MNENSPQPPDPQSTAPWYKRWTRKGKNSLLAITGLSAGIEAAKTIPSPLKIYTAQKNLLIKNIEDEEEFTRAQFADVCARWGIHNKEQLNNAIRYKKQEIWCGCFLMLFGLGVLFVQGAFFPMHGPMGFLQNVTLMSVIAVGALRALTSYWRLRVFHRRRFVPFLTWLGDCVRHGPGVLAMSIIPDVNVNESDITVQTLNQIFGQGWANLAKSAGAAGDGPTLIFSLLGTLNMTCTVAVVWIMILTILVGSVGAAQEGKSVGGKYNTAWVPVRISFSIAAIAPVIHGLNAMQIMILAAIGASGDMANGMFTTGLSYIDAHGGQITAQVSKPVQTTGQQLAVGAMRSMTLQDYLIHQVECSGAGSVIVQQDKAEEIILSFRAPQTCKGDAESLLMHGDLGAIVIPKSGNAQVDQARINGVNSMLQNLMQPAANLGGNRRFSFADQAAVQAAAQVYTSSVAQWLNMAAQNQDADSAKALSSFRQVAETQGWGMAGSYYWTMSVAATNAIDKMRDGSSYAMPKMEKVKTLLYADWYTQMEPTLNDMSKAGLMESQVSDAAMAATDQSLAGILSRSFAPFNELPKMASTLVSDPDAIIFLSRMARYVMNVTEGAIVATAFVSATAKGAEKAADSSLWGKAGDALTGGAVSGVITGASTLIDYALFIVTLIAVPLWTVCWFFAYAVPAIPYLCWMAALVGWLVLCVEAVIAAPLWLVGHSMPEGDGFAGMGGRAGYVLLLSVMLRPALLVISMFVCILIIMSTGMLIGFTFKPFVDSMNNIAGSFIGVTSAISLFVILGMLIGITTWKLFTLVTAMPDRIIRWVGQLLHNLGAEGQELATQAQGELKGAAKFSHNGMQSFSEQQVQRAAQDNKTATAASQVSDEHSMGDVGAKLEQDKSKNNY